jgi:membrane-bound metal-dependent hydrolase YbcI (DUF457 family)
MARFEQHVGVSAAIGAGLVGTGAGFLMLPWAIALAAGVLCTLGGVLPDLDHPRSRFAEFVLSSAAVLVVMLSWEWWHARVGGTAMEQLGIIVMGFWVVRWALRALLRRMTVHRGMFHSLPMCGVWTALVFWAAAGLPLPVRLFLAFAAGMGFLSHLVLDELFAFVDSSGMRWRPKRTVGSALKLGTRQAPWATLLTYGVLGVLLVLCWRSL